MKLAISNIAWDSAEEREVFNILRSGGVTGIEVAPTKLWPDWMGATEQSARRWRDRFTDQGFEIPALQSILFSVDGISIFGDATGRTALVEHVGRVAALGAGLGARVLVFGSPKLRDPGSLEPEQAWMAALEVFAGMAAACDRAGVVLGLEANPEAYGCRFATSLADCVKLVRDVGHPGLGLHLDTGQIAMAEAYPDGAMITRLPPLVHAHASQPWLGTFDKPADVHRGISLSLAAAQYEGWLSIEMRRQVDDPVGAILNAVNYVKLTYL